MSVLFKKEVFFVKFPILFPLLYLILLYSFPSFETQLVFITILLLAETHFGATWPFFLSKVNFPHINKNKFSFIYVPILIVVLCLLGFFLTKNFFLLIFFAANVYHVTRQSFGITNLYTKEPNQKKFFINIIYIFNFIFFLVAFFRFYIPLVNNEHLLVLNTIMIFLFGLTFIYSILKYNFSENFLTMVTGVLIFYPVCFVSNPVHAIIMGVTMHYSQYLYLTNKVLNKRESKIQYSNKINIFKNKFVLTIIAYSIVMSVLSIFGKNDSEFLSSLIIIPITGQMLHFYLDSQLWKFSESHNRENILKYLIN
tara:strand:+ start:755 stop:1687 length:933 start_codon:yes stop_codon:yes gene_type:complete